MYFRSKYLGIKKIQKYIISNVLIITVLLPFVVQFIHAFEKHEHLVCSAQNEIHFDTHEIDCSVFHFKINTNSINFDSKITFKEVDFNFEKIYSEIPQFKAFKLYYKSSRAPPFLLS